MFGSALLLLPLRATHLSAIRSFSVAQNLSFLEKIEGQVDVEGPALMC